MSKKDRRIILIAQCLVNPYCRVHILGQNFALSKQLTDYLMDKREQTPELLEAKRMDQSGRSPRVVSMVLRILYGAAITCGR